MCLWWQGFRQSSLIFAGYKSVLLEENRRNKFLWSWKLRCASAKRFDVLLMDFLIDEERRKRDTETEREGERDREIDGRLK